MFDLIVVGAGLAALVAAYTARKAGLQVKIIAKGLGAIQWGAGTVDVLGYYPDENTPVERPLETIRTLVKAQPSHPYARLDGTGLNDALQQFSALTREVGLPYAGTSDSGENLWLPSPAGAARPTFLAPQAQLAGDLHRKEPILIVGLRGMCDFFPALIADNLVKQGHPARAAFLPLALVTDRHDINTVQLAHLLDEPGCRNRLAAELKKLLQPGERIGLPAMVGMNDHVAAMNDLQHQTGAMVFEIPTLPPSVPGIRLNTVLQQRLEHMGVHVEANMEIIGFHAEDDRVVWMETRTSGRPLKHRAQNFLLATGGIVGGGIQSDRAGRVWETVLNLPLAMPQRRAEWFRVRFLDPAGHPIFRAGVPVNRNFQPVKPDGTHVYANVWAAGGLLAHADPILERSLEGIAVATGIAAANQLIATHRQESAASR